MGRISQIIEIIDYGHEVKDVDFIVPERLVEARRFRGIELNIAATLMEVNARTLIKWEKGIEVVDKKYLFKIMNLYRFPKEFFLQNIFKTLCHSPSSRTCSPNKSLRVDPVPYISSHEGKKSFLYPSRHLFQDCAVLSGHVGNNGFKCRPPPSPGTHSGFLGTTMTQMN